MPVNLEPVDVSETVEEPQISDTIDPQPENVAEQSPDNVAIESESKPTPKPTPPLEPKKRGRPRKEAAAKEPKTPKAAPQASRANEATVSRIKQRRGRNAPNTRRHGDVVARLLSKKKAITTTRKKANVEPIGRAELRAKPDF